MSAGDDAPAGSSTRPPLASVDDVRVELRRLGYLDSGLDRFVLGAAAGTPLATSRQVAVRVGFLGGALASAALLLLAVALDRGLLSEPRDLLLLALYLFLVLGLASGTVAWLAALAAAAWTRRRGRSASPRAPRTAGLVGGVVVLAWLALWWRSHAAGTSALAQAGALAVGLALSAALGRFVSLAAVAVLSAAGAAQHLQQASLSRRHMLPLLAGAALALGAGVALTSSLAGPSPPGVDFAVVPTGLRVRVLAVDGFEARLAEQLLARGSLPNLAALRARGAWARLQAEPEQVPAIVWTTIATGRGPEAHGIRAAGVRRLPGMRTPVPEAQSRVVAALGAAADLLRLTRAQPPTAVLRSVKTFWNVASDKGLRVGVANWWATWPADAVNGYVLSDRAVFKLESGGPADREVFPPEAFPALREQLPSADGAPTPYERARRLDAFTLGAARRLRGDQPLDLEALYLPGLDIVTMQEFGAAATADLASLDRRLESVHAYWAQLDAWLGEIAQALGPRDVLVLVGDAGRLARGGATLPEGVLLLAGGPVQAAADLGRVSARDVAPTVLHLIGLPVSRELDGRVLEAALTADFRAAHPVRSVDGYGRRPAAAPAESAFDKQMIEELRSLGYIQ